MKKCFKGLGIVLIFLIFPIAVHADGKSIDSNSSVSFYGKYIYDENKGDQDTNKNEGNEKIDGHSVANIARGNDHLPNTGDKEGLFETLQVSILGFLIILSGLYLKKKQEKDNYEM